MNMYKIRLNKTIDTNMPAIATIGNFDGMHLGHMELFRQLNVMAKRDNYRRIVITFAPLPVEYFSGKNLHRLSLLRDKYNLLMKYDLIDELIIFKFNKSFADLPPGEFINQILIKELNVVHVAIGHDFRFGKDREGQVTDFKKYNIQVHEMAPFYVGQNRVSSSMIRSLAVNNDFKQVYRLLGRNITYTSRVIYGNQLGRKFKVPTINLALGSNLPALWGIYTAHVYIEGKCYSAVASIGRNPTVSNQDSYKLEAHLLDVDLNLYGKIATIEILKFIREERKFNDLDSLFEQIHLDLQIARDYFNCRDK